MELIVICFFCISAYMILKEVDSAFTPTNSTLMQVHVLFRHGNRTPNGPEELYPNDPYKNEKYFPVGLGQLTNEGKRREYNIGLVLRGRYNEFLGKYYYPEIVEPLTTDYNRTKMSLLLVLAGLFPPRGEQKWNYELNWQPVPYNYLPRKLDKILLGVLCPYYLALYEKQVQSPRQQSEYKKYKETFDYISKHSGLNVTTFLDVYNLYFGLAAEEEWGFKLPEWTKSVWPKTITELAIREYFVATASTDLRRMAAGYFLEQVITYINAKIKGTDKGTKMFLYSAHENNIAELLIVLDLFDKPHIPPYGSFIVFEVHKIHNSYGIKIYYQNYSSKSPQLLKLSACEHICEISKFIALVNEYFPKGDLCGNNNCL